MLLSTVFWTRDERQDEQKLSEIELFNENGKYVKLNEGCCDIKVMSAQTNELSYFMYITFLKSWMEFSC